MAVVVPSSSSTDQIPPPPLPPHSSSSNTPTQSNPLPQSAHPQVDSNHEAVDVSERKPELMESFQDLDTNNTEKYKKYEADYVRRIKAKYFSKKNLYGGNIFENETTIENEVIKSSRWPSTRSYTDPVQSFEDHSRSSSTSAAEISANLSSRKYQSKKSSS